MRARFALIGAAVLFSAVPWPGAGPSRLASQTLDPKSYESLLKPAVSVVPQGTRADFQLSANLPAAFQIWVSETAPQGCCQFPPAPW